MNKQMEPCPFCGHVFEVLPTHDRLGYDEYGECAAVICPNLKCQAYGPIVRTDDHETVLDTEAAAIAAWNRRSSAMPQADWDSPITPDAAEFWAVDPTGEAMFYELEPLRYETVTFCGWGPQVIYGIEQGSKWGAGHIELPFGVDWRMTLQRRPGPRQGKEPTE